MKKAKKFYQNLITRAEVHQAINNVSITYFSNDCKVLDAETKECKYYVTEGTVYDNTEKISSKMAKYSANLGLLY
jgi:hypothetical protein